LRTDRDKKRLATFVDIAKASLREPAGTKTSTLAK
jgi:hypothetical protein